MGWFGKRKEEPDGLVMQLEAGEQAYEVEMGEQGQALRVVCAWCLAEQGIEPDPADSHGICAFHSAQMLQAYHGRRAR